MRPGEVVLHKSWNIPVLLIKFYKNLEKHPSTLATYTRSCWEVLIDGDVELVYESELEAIDGN